MEEYNLEELKRLAEVWEGFIKASANDSKLAKDWNIKKCL